MLNIINVKYDPLKSWLEIPDYENKNKKYRPESAVPQKETRSPRL